MTIAPHRPPHQAYPALPPYDGDDQTTDPRRHPYHPASVPTRQERHLLSRFSYGVTRTLVAHVHKAGGAAHWFENQLHPSRIPDPDAHAMRGWYPHLNHSPQRLWADNQAGSYYGWQVMTDLQRWTIMRRTYSHHQLFETMVELWSNLLHVPAGSDKAWPWRVDYDAMIRRHAFGRFDDLLYAAETHPAMGCNLDNAVNDKQAVNENLGREMLELHTVGIGAGYTQAMVHSSAQIMTGWRVDMWNTWDASYDPGEHWTGPVHVLGFKDANRDADGRELTKRYLSYLAHHPDTARQIARRLCTHFVSDDPSARLVSHIAAVFHRSGTDITTTLRAIAASKEFKASVDAKTRTPSEDAIAPSRA